MAITASKRIALYALAGAALALGLLLGCTSPPPRGGSGPAQAEGMIYLASRDGRLFAVKPASRSQGLPFPADGEWVYPANGQAGAIYSRPIPDQGNLYFGTFEGKVFSLNPASRSKGLPFPDAGTGEWQTPLSAGGAIVGSPAASRDMVFVAAGSRIYALARATGKDRWPQPFKAGDRVWSDLVLQGDSLYFGSLDHRLYALNTATGELRWKSPFAARGALASTPLLAEGTLYIGSFDGSFYALDAATGQPRWAEPFRARGWFWTRAARKGGMVYAGSLDGRAYGIDARTGRLAWAEPFVAGSPLRAAPVVVADTLIVATTGGQVYGLEASTGRPRWPVAFTPGAGVTADLAAAGEVVYVHADNGTLYALEAATGRALWAFPVKK